MTIYDLKWSDRGWDGWMAWLTRWTWVWVNSRRWWWTGRPGVLWFMGSQRVRHDWATELNWTGLMQCCFLQDWILFLSPVTSTTGYCFRFGSIPSFFLELFLHWSPVAYWAPTDLGSSSFNVPSFCLLKLFMGFSRQEYWSRLPFLSPVDHILSDLSTTTRPSWVAPRDMA